MDDPVMCLAEGGGIGTLERRFSARDDQCAALYVDLGTELSEYLGDGFGSRDKTLLVGYYELEILILMGENINHLSTLVAFDAQFRVRFHGLANVLAGIGECSFELCDSADPYREGRVRLREVSDLVAEVLDGGPRASGFPGFRHGFFLSVRCGECTEKRALC